MEDILHVLLIVRHKVEIEEGEDCGESDNKQDIESHQHIDASVQLRLLELVFALVHNQLAIGGRMED